MTKALGSLALMRAAAKTAEVTAAGTPASPLADAANADTDPDRHPSRKVRREEPPERDAGATDPEPTGEIQTFLERHFLHYNAGTMRAAAEAWRDHVDAGGAVVLTLAGAMSTAQLGRSIAPLIRAGKVHAISTTGANLEEDLMNLIGRTRYEEIPEYRDLTPEDEQDIYDDEKNRVTDSAIPDSVMVPLAKAMLKEWQRAERAGERYFPHEVLYKVLRSGTLEDQYVIDADESWLMAAMEANLPIVVPGW
ncbi:MAG: deoxyhypusine synthase family protein, partial [Gemmatimonadaceae bacterium]